MELVNEVDLLSSAIILLSILLSYFRGILRECFTIVAWIVSLALSINFGPNLIPIMVEIPFLQEFFLGNCPLTMLVSFVLAFVLSLTFFSLLITFSVPRQSKDREISILGNLDRMAGIMFGFGRAIVILIFLLICVDDLLQRSYLPDSLLKKLDESASNKFLMPSKTLIKEEVFENASTWFSDTYQLILNNECPD
ncbi:MAG: hypothetical protein CML37_03550 [Rhodobacteraceae bacterium]|nr:hypothetical protein [Paracoccaceae bacterium]